MSSSLSDMSAPYRLGEGMSLRARTSTSPRNITTASAVMISDATRLKWLESNRTRKNAGAVSSATNVAARVSLRHSVANADACSLIEPGGPRSLLCIGHALA